MNTELIHTAYLRYMRFTCMVFEEVSDRVTGDGRCGDGGKEKGGAVRRRYERLDIMMRCPSIVERRPGALSDLTRGPLECIQSCSNRSCSSLLIHHVD